MSDVSEPAAMNGLTSSEAGRKLAEVGPNQIVIAARSPLIVQLLRRFASPLVAILIVASVISGLVGDVINAAIILLMVVISVGIEFVQTHRSERAADALRSRVASTATVRRDGDWKELPRAELVPGDVIRLVPGDLVPADARLLSTSDLHVTEAALTGESVPAEKQVDDAATTLAVGDRHGVFLGSSVVSGRGTALVVTTGKATAFGGIAKSLVHRPPPTEFERGVSRFGVFILKIVVFMVLFVFAVSAAMRHDALESLLFAVALAVGLTPEFLPMITTVTLTRGAVRMAKGHVIVKNLAAIQNFGSMDILCSDKTGTLTSGEMRLERHVDASGKETEHPLLLAYMNSFFQRGLDNPVDTAVLAKAKLDPIDSAVLEHEHPDISGFTKVCEIPFDFERRRVSIVASRNHEGVLVTKGAFEAVLAVCTTYERDGQRIPLDDDARRTATTTVQKLSSEGYRVIAVAFTSCAPDTKKTKADERELTLAGFLGFVDPARPDAKEVLERLRRAGVEVKVLTGDSDLVAAHVCGEVGISTADMIRGDELDAMSDAALAHRAERAQVFARVTPAQKTRIVHALKTRGHVVGFLGDGINDAPSLHAADVGIAVSTATDVAREASDIVLLEPGLRALSSGVLEGRRAFGNIMKYLLMGTSSNFGNMFSMAAAAAFLPFLPMLPKQILLNNFLYDLAQITIPTDNVDEDLIRKPRRWDIALIRRFMMWIGPISSVYDFLTFWVLIHVLGAGPELFHTGWFVESLATQTLVIFVIRTGANPFRSRPKGALTVTTLAVVAAACLLPFTPAATWLGFVPLPAWYFGFLAVATVSYLVIVQLVKRVVLRPVLS